MASLEAGAARLPASSKQVMETIRSTLLLGLLVCLAPPLTAADEVQVDYTLVANPPETPVPGIDDSFASLGSPSVSGSHVAFYGAVGELVPGSPFVPTHRGLYIRHISGPNCTTTAI